MKNLILTFAYILLFACTHEKECVKPDKCNLEPDAGLCKAAFRKYYFDKVEKKCKEFIWGGCGGVVPFDTLEECKECECQQSK